MNKNFSKLLSLILRHKPESIKLKLDKNGWANIDELLDLLKKEKNIDLTKLDLDLIVENNDKKRFSYNEDQTKIRANQGHSINIDLELEKKTPPLELYHGTSKKNKDSIIKNGILKGNRNHVHLSSDIETAISVGKRHGEPIVFVINTRKVMGTGKYFYLSKNNVWLVDFIPPECIKLKE